MIPIAIEWVILVTTLAPSLLIGRFNRYPRIGLTFWFATLLSAGIAIATALSIALFSVVQTYLLLVENPVGSESWLFALTASFAPWLILAVAGISLVLVNQRVAPMIALANQTTPLLTAAAKPVREFAGLPVRSIQVPIMVAAAHRGSILVSTEALASLSEAELEAVLWHEVGHIRSRHNQLKQLAGFVLLLSPWLAASRALVAEVERLAEVDADRFAAKRVSVEVLAETRAKFVSA